MTPLPPSVMFHHKNSNPPKTDVTNPYPPPPTVAKNFKLECMNANPSISPSPGDGDLSLSSLTQYDDLRSLMVIGLTIALWDRDMKARENKTRMF